jgi:hypothetical protein
MAAGALLIRPKRGFWLHLSRAEQVESIDCAGGLIAETYRVPNQNLDGVDRAIDVARASLLLEPPDGSESYGSD